jgi:hypothetical protein
MRARWVSSIVLPCLFALGCGDDSSGSGGSGAGSSSTGGASGTGAGGPGTGDWVVLMQPNRLQAVDLSAPASRRVELEVITGFDPVVHASEGRRRFVARTEGAMHIFAPERGLAWEELDLGLGGWVGARWAPRGQRLTVNGPFAFPSPGPLAVIDFEADPAGKVVPIGDASGGARFIPTGDHAWSSDGGFLALTNSLEPTEQALYVWNAAQPEQAPTQLEQRLTGAHFSPTAPLLVTVEPSTPPRGRIHRLGGAEPSVDLGDFVGFSYVFPFFSPDGATLVAPAAIPMAAFDPNASAPQPTTIEAYPFRAMKFSPRSRWLVHIDGDFDNDSSVVMLSPRLGPTSFGAPVAVGEKGEGLYDVFFTPDESRLIFWRERGVHDVYDLSGVYEGSAQPTLSARVESDETFTTEHIEPVSPDGRWFVARDAAVGLRFVDLAASPAAPRDLIAGAELGPAGQEVTVARFAWVDAERALLLSHTNTEHRVYLMRLTGDVASFELLESLDALFDVGDKLGWGDL